MIKQTQWSVLESKFVESPLWSGPALSYGIITLIHYGGSGIFSILMKKKKLRLREVKQFVQGHTRIK